MGLLPMERAGWAERGSKWGKNDKKRHFSIRKLPAPLQVGIISKGKSCYCAVNECQENRLELQKQNSPAVPESSTHNFSTHKLNPA